MVDDNCKSMPRDTKVQAGAKWDLEISNMKIDNLGCMMAEVTNVDVKWEIAVDVRCCCRSGFKTTEGVKFFEETVGSTPSVMVFTNNFILGITAVTSVMDLPAATLASLLTVNIQFVGNDGLTFGAFVRATGPPNTDWRSLSEGEWEGGNPCHEL